VGSLEEATREFWPFLPLAPTVPVSPLHTYCVLFTSEGSRMLLPLSSIPASTWMPPFGHADAGAAPRTTAIVEFADITVFPPPVEPPPPPPLLQDATMIAEQSRHIKLPGLRFMEIALLQADVTRDEMNKNSGLEILRESDLICAS
jgi:hypothetical protein